MVQEPTWPATDLVEITPSDATEYLPALRQIYVGTTGNITVVTDNGTEVTFSNVPAGMLLGPFFVKQVKAATTASDLVGFE